MKKILSIFFCIVFVFSAFAVSVSALSTNTSTAYDETSVEDDLNTIFHNVEQIFSLDASLDELSLVNITEYGYDELKGIGRDYALYLYLYNPSGKDVTDGLNKVQFATSWKIDARGNLVGANYEKFDLIVLDSNETNTLIKCRVSGANEKIMFLTQDDKRRYDISGIELARTPYDYEEYSVGYSYIFSGYMKGFSKESSEKSTLHCQRDSFLTLDLDVHQVSYLTGDSAKGAGYSNQINSVYFSIPANIEKKYGSLYDIKYEYYHYFLSPVIVTNNYKSYQTLLADRGQIVDDSWRYNISNYDLIPGSFFESLTRIFYFSYGKQFTSSIGSTCIYKDCKILDCLTTVFYKSDLEKESEGLLLATSEELLQYIQDYDLSYHRGTVLKRYSADLFDLKKSKGYICNTVTVDDAFSLDSYDDAYGNKLQRFLDYGFLYTGSDHDVSVVDAKYIEEVTNSKLFASNFEELMLIQNCYKDDLDDFYKAALSEGEKTYVLRYAFSDDYYSLDLVGSRIDGDFLMAEGNIYLNFDIIQMTFMNSEGVRTVIPVSSAPLDGAPDIFDTSPDRDTFEEKTEELLPSFLNVIKKILIVFVILIIIVICIFATPSIIDFFRELFKRNGKSKSTQNQSSTKKKTKYKQGSSSSSGKRKRSINARRKKR
ncbi:MAG: hypothetical protein IKJ07_07835 [Clostridia bacterium]|nr:hypothetical protein [Clostridia bacterium]